MDGLAIICALIVFFLPIYQDYKKTARMVRRSEKKILCIRAGNVCYPLYDIWWGDVQIPYRMVKQDA